MSLFCQSGSLTPCTIQLAKKYSGVDSLKLKGQTHSEILSLFY